MILRSQTFIVSDLSPLIMCKMKFLLVFEHNLNFMISNFFNLRKDISQKDTVKTDHYFINLNVDHNFSLIGYQILKS
jgi:hypothetical protein